MTLETPHLTLFFTIIFIEFLALSLLHFALFLVILAHCMRNMIAVFVCLSVRGERAHNFTHIQKSNKNDNDDLASLLSRINYYHKSIARFSPPPPVSLHRAMCLVRPFAASLFILISLYTRGSDICKKRRRRRRRTNKCTNQRRMRQSVEFERARKTPLVWI